VGQSRFQSGEPSNGVGGSQLNSEQDRDRVAPIREMIPLGALEGGGHISSFDEGRCIYLSRPFL
jgi:hypothetical protein